MFNLDIVLYVLGAIGLTLLVIAGPVLYLRRRAERHGPLFTGESTPGQRVLATVLGGGALALLVLAQLWIWQGFAERWPTAGEAGFTSTSIFDVAMFCLGAAGQLWIFWGVLARIPFALLLYGLRSDDRRIKELQRRRQDRGRSIPD